MSRTRTALLCAALLLLAALFTLSGTPPVVTAQETPKGDQPSGAQPPAATQDPGVGGVGQPAPPATSQFMVTATFTFTPAPASATPQATPTVFVDETLPLIINNRLDLETLATSLTGLDRPQGWSGGAAVGDPIQTAILARLDLELLAGTQYDPVSRPDGWFGAVSSTPFALARDVRHDLELLADALVAVNVRPPGWLGADPLYRCNRATQTLVAFLERNGLFTLSADPAAPDFCRQAEVLASQFVEVNFLNNAAPGAGGGVPGVSAPNTVTPANQFAIAFLDSGAQRRAGVIPVGTPMTPVARSTATFSRMMLVRGEGFEVFVEWDFTTITEEQFLALPGVDTLTSAPFCDAGWCER